MKKILITLGIAASIFMILVSILGIIMGIRYLDRAGMPTGKQIVLHLDFSQGIVEEYSADPFARFTSRGTLRLLDMIRLLDHAASDPKVAGMIADLSEMSMGLAQAQEIRNAIGRFSDSGKWTVAYADTFFNSKTGTGVYYMASAFDEIYMHPAGDVGFLGLAIEPFFVRKTLDKLGVVSYMDQRYEYKTVANMWNETGYTDAHRESDTNLMNSIFSTIVTDVAASRNMEPDHVRSLVDRAPFLGREALDAGLVDGFRFWDQVMERMEEKAGGDIALVKPGTYLKKKVPAFKNDGEYVVALVYAIGEVVRGGSSPSMTGGSTISAKNYVDIFEQIREDGDVDAVVFRVSSPGGSPDASATIDHEIQRLREAGIPVIVSMGDVAASGGYYIAMHADAILAQPMTLTGSIGVAGGKFVIRGLLERLGITTDEVHVGDNALLLSLNAEPNESQMERFKALMDRIYDDFTQGVMDGRKLTPDQIDAVARGRVWTGADAINVSLVDQLGGLYEALVRARTVAGIPDEEEPAVRIYPRKKTFLETLRDPDAGFFTRAGKAVRTFFMLMQLVDSAAGPELRTLNRMMAADTLTSPVHTGELLLQ